MRSKTGMRQARGIRSPAGSVTSQCCGFRRQNTNRGMMREGFNNLTAVRVFDCIAVPSQAVFPFAQRQRTLTLADHQFDDLRRDHGSFLNMTDILRLQIMFH
jgi:hypothetical protein